MTKIVSFLAFYKTPLPFWKNEQISNIYVLYSAEQDNFLQCNVGGTFFIENWLHCLFCSALAVTKYKQYSPCHTMTCHSMSWHGIVAKYK